MVSLKGKGHTYTAVIQVKATILIHWTFFQWQVLAIARQTWNMVIISCQGTDIIGKGTQQPHTISMLKKFQSATGSDSYRT